METFPFDSWAGRCAVHVRNVPHGEVVAALLVDLAADPRGVYLAPSVAFPPAPAARALGVPAVLVRTALHQLSEAGLVRVGTEDDHEDGPQVRVTLLPPFPEATAGADSLALSPAGRRDADDTTGS
ncbi:hypothetical protein [Streptomyces virginiae]|uniref:hypothetical protein n=1 Tax=Streptomyces virginiae TaxID=1961 RepID=UPI002DDB08DC|nr:hypothetical protein [Streptomyces virginiae]WSC75468.1 hypothetical protein OHA56_03580 [Streptomyces virginiae]